MRIARDRLEIWAVIAVGGIALIGALELIHRVNPALAYAVAALALVLSTIRFLVLLARRRKQVP